MENQNSFLHSAGALDGSQAFMSMHKVVRALPPRLTLSSTVNRMAGSLWVQGTGNGFTLHYMQRQQTANPDRREDRLPRVRQNSDLTGRLRSTGIRGA